MTSLGFFRVQPIGTALSGLIPVQIREYRPSISLSLCALTLICSILLGGGTRGGFLSDTILELISIPVLLISLSSLIDLSIWQTRTRPDIYLGLAFCIVIVVLPLIQLVPLPPGLWSNLPGRADIANVFDALGDQKPWLPLSVSPHATWLSFLSLFPPMAIFITATQLDYRERRELSLVIVAIGIISVFVGLTQVADGPASLLRFFTITNNTEAVGFFANRNHFAALLYAVLLFAAVWAIDIGFKIKSWGDLKSFETGTAVALLAILMIFVIIIAGEAMARSRAGLALTIVALLAVFTLAFMDARNAPGAKASKLILGATIFAVILSMQFAVYRILDRFATDPLENARGVFALNTIKGAKAFMPFGAGSGTFVPVYQLFERPSDAIANTYANHAHNDILGLWLETGVLGPVLLCLFVVWFAFRTVKLWRRPAVDASAFDRTLARAATVIIVLLLAHSFVDYPMRTEAIMAVFAVCCALIIEPLNEAEDGIKFAASLERYLVRRKEAPKAKATAAPVNSSSLMPAAPLGLSEREPPRPRQAARRWGAEIDWPEEWRSSDQKDQSNPKSDTNPATKVDRES